MHRVVGDCDSLNASEVASFAAAGSAIERHPTEKDATDTELALLAALDAGATQTGRPFFVMELVKGDPITSYCDRNSVSIQERLELFAQVCDAVQHAHAKGVIHCDIKPANIFMVGRTLPKVLDFGIARVAHLQAVPGFEDMIAG